MACANCADLPHAQAAIGNSGVRPQKRASLFTHLWAIGKKGFTKTGWG